MSVQDTVGSELSFAAVVHLGQTVPAGLLRCVLDVRGMVSTRTGQMDVAVEEGGVRAPSAPGLGVEVNLEQMGEPVLSFS